MDHDWSPPKPKKIVQKFSKDNLEKFRNMPPKAKLAWLEDINRLFWKAAAHRRPAVH